MKGKIIFGLRLSCCLFGCSSNASGIIECYTIEVTSGGKSVLNKTYSSSSGKVYEYRNENGDSIYLSSNVKGTDYYYSNSDDQDAEIRVFKDRYTTKYTTYTYLGFIGFLTIEQNYYYNTIRKIIDCETKCSEYRYEKNPDDLQANNPKAYACAKQGYYKVNSTTQSKDASTKKFYYPLILDLEDKSLVRHTYIKLGEDSIVSYKVKWFE